MKARSDVQQPSFTCKTLDGIDYVYLYVNEVQIVNDSDHDYDTSDSTESHTEYEYDFNEFSAKSGTMSLDEIKEDPAKYIDYIPADSASLETRVSDLEVFVDALLGGMTE
nr:hypothetical protein [uncultured Lachnoclostridium sp.]